jgi:peptide deformylase
MCPLKIIEYPDSVLQKKALEVKEITGKEIGLFEEMLFTMYHFAGIGLAAPQIGISKSLIVVDIGEGPIKLADPVVLNAKGLDAMEEGCLSIPGIGVIVERPNKITVSGLNEKGKVVAIEAQGLLARVLQHEIDHLKGKLIIDYMGLLEKMMLFKSKFKKVKDEHANS